MSLHHIAQLLQQRMGLHSSTVGDNTIARAINQRMRDCRIDVIQDYCDVVSHSDTELNALIEAVVIPETWFYREPNAFHAFSAWLRSDWLPNRSATSILRILSVPCSSGEEPYTLAMCLAECGITARQAQIDAVDISSANLRKAAEARYGRNSFRGENLAYRERYFERRGADFQLSADIRQRVNFRRGNLLDSTFSENCPPYQVVFCRNLLIYFDRPTQHHAIDQLQALLSDSGLLFLGHSETSLLQKRAFSPLAFERCFGFRHGNGVAPTPQPGDKLPRRRRIDAPPRVRKPAPSPFCTVAPRPPQATAPVARPDTEQLLLQAFQLADQGHMDEAAACCETLLRNKVHQADAHYLLGIIREAAGNTRDAEQLFRKAVYLQPDHYEALVHLSVICEKTGDPETARRLLNRASRAQANRRPQGVEQ